MTELERGLLDVVDVRQPLVFDKEAFMATANTLGTTSQELAKAKNSLRDAGLISEQADVFTAGESVVRMTPAGSAALHPPPGSPTRHRVWWNPFTW